MPLAKRDVLWTVKINEFTSNEERVYQSGKKFEEDAGIQYYSKVTKCIPLSRSEITKIPKDSDELYYCFEAKIIPELWLRSEKEYRLYTELRRAPLEKLKEF